jgi:hypothetical protein
MSATCDFAVSKLSQNGERAQHLPVRASPAFPDAREGERGAVRPRDRERLLVWGLLSQAGFVAISAADHG